jgi:hypothetical protein
VWRLGVRGAARLGRLEIAVEAGWARTGALDFLPPFYGQVSFSYAFPIAGATAAPEAG